MTFVSESKAIESWLNDENRAWTEPLSVERKYAVYWQNDRQEVTAPKTLHTYVMPLVSDTVTGTREGPEFRRRYGIFLIQQLASNTDAEELARQDALTLLLDQIEGQLAATDRIAGKRMLIVTGEPRAALDVDAAQRDVYLSGLVIELRSP